MLITMTSAVYSATILCLVMGFTIVTAVVQVPCTGSDCHPYTMTQGTCKEVTSKPTSDCRWYAGLNPYVDVNILKGRIIAFQLQWFSGSWSSWFVPGVNDIGSKFISAPGSCFDAADATAANAKHLMRWWGYFYDHTHKYIICYNS